MAAEDEVQVSLVDDEEDLLEYDDTPDESPAEGSKGSANEVDSGEIRKAAEILLRREVPYVTVSYGTDVFLLFDCETKNEITGVTSIICEKESDLYDSCNGLFTTLRRFLERFYGSLTFLSKEILLEIPCLDFILCEDNVYNSQITFDDIATIFRILKERSEKNLEQNIPQLLETKITVRPRFVSRYNALVELTQSSATLGNIKPFKNDSSHPLVLDDPAVAAGETVVMDVDKDDEEDKEYKESKKVADSDLASSHDRAIEDDSDELLEIVDEDIR